MRIGLLLLLSTAACDDPAPRVQVRVCSDLRTPDEVDALRFTVRDEDRRDRYAGVTELGVPAAPTGADAEAPDAAAPDAGTNCGGETLSASASLPMPKGRGWVEVIALLAGVEVARAEVRARSADTDVTVRVPLRAICRGVRCMTGQTCDIEGGCALVPEPADVGPCPDAACGG